MEKLALSLTVITIFMIVAVLATVVINEYLLPDPYSRLRMLYDRIQNVRLFSGRSKDNRPA